MRPIVLLDGGTGQELLARSSNPPDPLWSARVMMDEPDIVRAVHADYLRAGARVITLNTYSATPERLKRYGAEDLFRPLQKTAIRLAHIALEETGADAAIAGCLPPLVASYRPDVVPAFETAVDIYRQIAAEQADEVDLLLCETLASVKEVRAAATAAAETGKPFWVAMTLKDGDKALLRSGEPLTEGIGTAVALGAGAVLANCCWPETITAALDELSAAAVPFGVYANRFDTIESLVPGGTVSSIKARTDFGPDAYAGFALDCANSGAAIIGGCCEVGPDHIRRTKSVLEDNGYKMVKELNA